VIQNLLQRYFAAVEAGGDQGGERFFEMEGVDFVEGEIAILETVKEFGVGTASGAEGFEGEGTASGLAQMSEQQARQDGFADSGVGAGDEEDTWAHCTNVFNQGLHGWHG
jgi:hypothetical protein